jgi:hypothetical protein
MNEILEKILLERVSTLEKKVERLEREKETWLKLTEANETRFKNLSDSIKVIMKII